jgi:RHS repeat-associated protein
MPAIAITNLGETDLTGPIGDDKVTIKPGGKYEFSSACDLAKFLNKAGGGVFEDSPGAVVDKINRMAEEEKCPERVTGVPVQAPDGPPSPGSPQGGDTPAKQGAPAATTNGVVSAEHGPYGEPNDARQPTEALHDKNPSSEGDIYDGERSRGKSPEEAARSVDKAKKGEPPAGEPRITLSGDLSPMYVLGGDPVDLFSGQLFISSTDIEVPTPFLPLRLERMYRSGLPYFGPWGFNWDHNWNVYLRKLNNGNVARWNGRMHEDIFEWKGAFFEPPRGIFERLEKEQGPEDQYTIRARRGVVTRFERPPGWTDAERIPLVSITDRAGNSVILKYDGENHLQHVRDDDGRGIDFFYGKCGLLEFIEDHAGRRVTYYHDQDAQHLAAVRTPPTKDFSEGLLTRYEYNEHPSHIALRHNILRIVDHAGNTLAINSYDEDRASPSFNRITCQIQGGYVYQFAYKQIQWVPSDPLFIDIPATQTAVTYPDGSLWTYTFNYRADLLDQRFRLNADSSYRVIITKRRYDSQGNMTSVVHPDGARTESTFDHTNIDPLMRGNLLKVEQRPPPIVPVTSRVVWRAEYDPIFQFIRQITSENGAETRFIYDFDIKPDPHNHGDLIRLERPIATLPDGSKQHSILTFEPDARGRSKAIIAPEGARDEFVYEPAGSAKSGFLREYRADVSGADEITKYDYDTFGYLADSIAPGGARLSTHYNSQGSLESAELPTVDGIIDSFHYSYNVQQNLARVLRPRGDYNDNTISDSWLEDVFVDDPLGHRLESTVGANTAQPRRFLSTPDFRGRALKTVDPIGAVTRRSFDERGLMLAVVVADETPDQMETRYVYDSVGRLKELVIPGNRTKTIDYDPFGRPAHIHFPNGSEQILVWGTEDRLLEVRIEGDPGDGGPMRLLTRKRFDYDERGRRIRVKEASFRENPNQSIDLVTEYFYDRNDRLHKVKTHRGATFTTEYDGRNRVKTSTDPFGNQTRVTYDDAGNAALVERIDVEPQGPRSRISRRQYDARRRLRVVTGPSGSVTELDYDGRDLLAECRKPLGITVRTRHGLLGEVVEQVVDPGGLSIVTRQEFDLLGRRVKFIDPTLQLTVWSRDELGRQISVALPDGGQSDSHWGPLGTIIGQTTPSGSRFTFDYDPQSGELRQMTCVAAAGVSGVPDHTFQYDGLGRRVLAAIPGRAIRREYDSRNRLVEETVQGRSVRIFFNDVAGTRQRVFPDGRTERTDTDIAGRPIEIALIAAGALGGNVGSVARFTYGGSSRLYQLDYGNSVRAAFAYDDAARLIRIEHSRNGLALESARYRYDAANRRRVAQLTGRPILNRVQQFDRRMRLVDVRWNFPLAPLKVANTQAAQDTDIAAAETAALAATIRESYVLDAADSRSSRVRVDGENAIQMAYGYAAGHQVTSVGPEKLGYHADGPRAFDGARKFDIDAMGRVVRVRDGSNGKIVLELDYDALSRVSGVVIKESVFTRWFEGEQWVHEEADNAVARQRTIGPFSPVPLLEMSSSGAITPLADGGLCVVCLTDATGDVVERFRFEPFGRPTIFNPTGAVRNASAVGFDPTFAGMAFLTAAQLYQSSARLYDPQLGVFFSRDPFLHRDSPSPYLYAVHNPVDYVDPSGTSVESHEKNIPSDLLDDYYNLKRIQDQQMRPHRLRESVLSYVLPENRTDWVKENAARITSIVPGPFLNRGNPSAYGIEGDDATVLFNKWGEYVGEYNLHPGAVRPLVDPVGLLGAQLANTIAPVFTGLSKSTIAAANAAAADASYYESIEFVINGSTLTERQGALFINKALQIAETEPTSAGAFWSNSRAGAMDAAKAYAIGTGTNVLETTPLGTALEQLKMSDAGIPWEVQKEAWAIACRRYAAAQPFGSTPAAFIEHAAPQSQYLQIELQTMAEMGNVRHLRLMRGMWPNVAQYGVSEPSLDYLELQVLFPTSVK